MLLGGRAECRVQELVFLHLAINSRTQNVYYLNSWHPMKSLELSSLMMAEAAMICVQASSSLFSLGRSASSYTFTEPAESYPPSHSEPQPEFCFQFEGSAPLCSLATLRASRDLRVCLVQEAPSVGSSGYITKARTGSDLLVTLETAFQSSSRE